MNTILFTGFPGFLGSELLPRVLRREPDARALCVVQRRWLGVARERLAAIEAREPELAGRTRLAEGDIVEPNLGLRDADALRHQVTAIYHLAAIYDLSVPRELAMRVNVHGTERVLHLAAQSPRLARLHYVSTCYVSGRHRGVFRESDLDVGQTFNNHYEETKYLAEVAVRRAMRAGLPATIYRPSIVVGDSLTGATQKYDGPYFAMQWLLRQPRIAVMPVIGDARATEFNVVPRDFVIDAIEHLSAHPHAAGATFALADPRPLTVDEILDTLARATERRVVRIPLPLGVAKWSIDRIPGVYALMRIPASAVDYFVHPTRYDTTQASAALSESSIVCPSFGSYAPALVRFMREHPEVGSAAMV
ncbi:MAG: SDR family oxidoreductase [Gemmatimonadaceae bacterium]|nr:SDR family oxidoreductase [Gemmatimonadaceae bacterium]NUQ94272.1 SDR family oxidoreductase [Gemmatimonadaceae bacterium]NUR18668.1 SDR family oxidoreductase [Gemmatimonadaceae bacterium]NUS96794.1 SDR family oxidoreductase [Gemmatimonadaceae bacterium]